jgi:excisionase family DNA binding protein
MPVKIGGNVFYRTAEVCKIAGVSKNTFLRWIREGVIIDAEKRDRRGWRIFTEEELKILEKEANRIISSKRGK